MNRQALAAYIYNERARRAHNLAKGGGVAVPPKLIVLNASDSTALFQEITGASATTPAGVGDLVGTVINTGLLGGYWTAPTTGVRPVLRQTGALYYLEFSGTNRLVLPLSPNLDRVVYHMGWRYGSGIAFMDGTTVGARRAIYAASANYAYLTAANYTTDIALGSTDKAAAFGFDDHRGFIMEAGAKSRPIAPGTIATIPGITLGAAYDGSNGFSGRIYGLTVSRVYRDEYLEEVATLAGAAPSRPTDLIVCDGNSLTYGHLVNANQSYPYLLGGSRGSSALVINNGVNSRTTAQMTAEAPTGIDVLLTSKMSRSVLVAWEATNSIAFGATFAEARDEYIAYLAARTAAGWRRGSNRIIACSCADRQEATGWDATKRGYLQDFNAWIAANWADYADGYVDLGAAPLDDATNTTYFNADKTHLTATGYSLVNDRVDAGIDALT